jgi:hypothetical protein
MSSTTRAFDDCITNPTSNQHSVILGPNADCQSFTWATSRITSLFQYFQGLIATFQPLTVVAWWTQQARIRLALYTAPVGVWFCTLLNLEHGPNITQNLFILCMYSFWDLTFLLPPLCWSMSLQQIHATRVLDLPRSRLLCGVQQRTVLTLTSDYIVSAWPRHLRLTWHDPKPWQYTSLTVAWSLS